MGWLQVLAVFVTVALTHALSPVGTSYDSRWTVPIAVSLLERGDTNIDEYTALIVPGSEYSVVRAQGHLYSWYPIGGPLFAVPVVAAIRTAAHVASPLLALSGRESIQALARGDLIASHAVVEELAASVYVALTAALLFLIIRRFLPPGGAALIVMAFAFGSSAWSTASRAFWQHTPSMLLLTITLWIALSAADRPSMVQFAAIPLALSFCVRPTNVVPVAVFTIWVAVEHRRYLLRYLLLAAPIAAAFAAYHLSVYGEPLPGYYLLTPGDKQTSSWPAAVAGLLISPSRGLLIYTPWVAFAAAGAVIAWKTRWLGNLPRYLTAIVILHFLILSTFRTIWHGGHSYGPRTFTDMMPICALLLTPLFLRWREVRPTAQIAAFSVMLAVAVFMHARGATNAVVYRWNVDPVNVDVAPARVWDWSDPQFMRGL